MSNVWFLILGLFLGWLLAGPVVRNIRSPHPVAARIGIGVIGAIVGFLVMRAFGFTQGSLTYAAVVAILGAVVLVALATLIKRG